METIHFGQLEKEDMHNLHKMAKYNPEQQSFSFSENDLPSNLDVDED